MSPALHQEGKVWTSEEGGWGGARREGGRGQGPRGREAELPEGPQEKLQAL